MFQHKIIFTFLFSTLGFAIFGQDSTITLKAVVVKGFETNRPLLETAGSVNILKIKDLTRFDNTSFLPVMNILPGVRMEERSPGSYRLAIRGSSLRSPFGVRNVKVYWNDIQLTDANGSTYLNAIDLGSIGSVEVLKGPAGSIYGASTGGVLLLTGINAQQTKPLGLELNLQTGSFNTQRFGLNWAAASDKSNQQISIQRQQTDGYRDHSAMQRSVLNWKASYFISSKKTINTAVLLADIAYETPGGLTLEQLKVNPKAARPKAGLILGATEQKAGIFQKNALIGFSQSYVFNPRLSNYSSVFSGLAAIKNPFITNYEKRFEQSFGGRTRFLWQEKNIKLPYKITLGAELSRTFSSIHNYGNRQGKSDTLQFEDEVLATQAFVFGQAEIDLPHQLYITLGGSLNSTRFVYEKVSSPKLPIIKANLTPNFSPRLTILKKINDSFSAYLTYSEGFAAPSVAEYVTAARLPNQSLLLDAEFAKNYEVGFRGTLLKYVDFDLATYRFKLQNTIVRRVDEKGQAYFVNAGNTNQNGFEAMVSSTILAKKYQLNPFFSTTVNNYTFVNYIQTKTDLSGKKLPGIPKFIAVLGLDLRLLKGFYVITTYQSVTAVPLNDANTIEAAAYQLLAAKLGWRINAPQTNLDFYVGIDNALDAFYSLGNDFNAAGNRFYNPAPGRNFYGGMLLKF